MESKSALTPIWTGRRRALKPGADGAPCLYYHVAPPDYQPGQDLLPATELGTTEESRERWGLSEDIYLADWEAVSLHDNRPEAEEYAQEYGQPGSWLLTIALPPYIVDGNNLRCYVNDEGYPCVRGRISASLIIGKRQL